VPIIATTRFIPGSISGTANKGGWLADGSFANDQFNMQYGRRMEIWVRPEGGGVWEEDAHLCLRGSCVPASVRFDFQQSASQATVCTTDSFLGMAGLQGLYFADPSKFDTPAAPDNTHQYDPLNLGIIIKHILEQHTNISSTAFVQNSDGTYSATPVGGWVDTSHIDTVDSTTVDVYSVSQSSSIWNTCRAIGANEFYVLYFDKQDVVRYEPHPMFAAVLPEPALELDNTLIAGMPEIVLRNRLLVDQAHLMGLTDNGEILESKYPGEIGTEGRIHEEFNIRCNDQPRLDELSQRVWYYQNRLASFHCELAGPWGTYLELYDRISVTYTGTTRNGVSIVWSDKMFWIENITTRMAGTRNATTSLELVEENFEEGDIYDYTYP
jgi:hypothetical protein